MAVVAAARATDQVEPGAIHMALVGQHGIIDMGQQHAGEDQVAVGFSAGYGDLRHLALEATAAAAIRGGATLDTVGMPTVSISLTPWGSQAEVAFMVSAWAAPTGWITNCPVAWTLRRVSLEAAVVAQADVDHQGRRLVADHLEEAERG